MTDRSVRRRGVLTRDDLRVWAHVTRGVEAMSGKAAFTYEEALQDVVAMPEPAASPKAAQAAARSAAKQPPLAPLERKMRQRLSRGQKPVDGVIDLHGMRQSEAHAALLNFLHRAQHEGRSIVLVITGKGLEGEAADTGMRGVLRRMVPHWLGDPTLRRHVVGFEPAARGHGGEGALYVRIRKLRG